MLLLNSWKYVGVHSKNGGEDSPRKNKYIMVAIRNALNRCISSSKLESEGWLFENFIIEDCAIANYVYLIYKNEMKIKHVKKAVKRIKNHE